MNVMLLPSSTTPSTSSEDLYATFVSESADSTSRRTRKRFSNAQLTMLEQLFHQNSHPSREQREVCARACNMEVKSVTIWFQNKRQTERRTTLASGRVPPPVMIHSRGSYQRMPSPVPSSLSMASSTSSRSTTSLSGSKRPSLDCVASRSELRAPAPRTPHRRHNPNAPLWENMPNSPVGPQFSPPARDFVDFGHDHQSRTLEWACARSRLVGKGAAMDAVIPSRVPGLSYDEEDTDVEPDEAVTPPSTWGEGDARWTGKHGKMKMRVGGSGNTREATKTKTTTTVTKKTNEPDDDTMKAALALCGLMRG
ncbi:homeodomain transcription factor [Roridomyces roridus]|uniref:Homeodomain transcription factor n=1 Tax=Roridomyces roridus TaxID=1738132 RepID=A0AAD7BHZ9_9AGAR|nr:homeodomain transcription factor [Roridomyces roridus]